MQREHIAFSSYGFKHGLLDNCDPQFPSDLYAWDGEDANFDEPNSTHYGYCYEGNAMVQIGGNVFPLYAGMAFCAPGDCWVKGHPGSKGIIVTRHDFLGAPTLYGPLEYAGRLKYIDGCTDSLLIAPPKLGDPCLNLLYFPTDIDQTRHTHPSDRIGMILSGRGRCHYWNGGEQETLVDLEAGMIFRIHANGHHKFSTPYGEDMRVLAFHPDSDFGPTDEDHPMLNRTIVDGISAALIDSIRTR